MSNAAENALMERAIELARKGFGSTWPNPPVGAVIEKDGKILGEGWHQKAGEAHAEVNAIRDANARQGVNALVGATIYITLEPCSTHGRTPPCVEAILKAGFQRVVIGALDPNPAHAGAAVEILEARQIEVVSGVEEVAARHLIRGFDKHIRTGLPWVIAKSAITLTGDTTLPAGKGQWISSEASRRDVQELRRSVDAILVGGATVRRDNPSLTLRDGFEEGRPQPNRYVVTASGDIPPECYLLTDEFNGQTSIIQTDDPSRALEEIGSQGITMLLVESGGRLFTKMIQQELIDEEWL
ncbi:MAG: bifunctional diaminohydroxyphosphoribosylaminopyrimidine deaminase/5-amino-6-(5-phosphoribosylamino)uracil reductase RibD [Verrucomicrobiota bacterium]